MCLSVWHLPLPLRLFVSLCAALSSAPALRGEHSHLDWLAGRSLTAEVCLIIPLLSISSIRFYEFFVHNERTFGVGGMLGAVSALPHFWPWSASILPQSVLSGKANACFNERILALASLTCDKPPWIAAKIGPRYIRRSRSRCCVANVLRVEMRILQCCCSSHLGHVTSRHG